MVRYLIEEAGLPAAPKESSYYSIQTSPVLHACINNHLDVAQYLVENHKVSTRWETDHDSNEMDYPITVAITYNNLDLIKILLENGGSLYDDYENGYLNSLGLAIESEYFDIAEYLMEKGANELEKTTDGEFPLAVACMYAPVEFLEKMIKKCYKWIHNDKEMITTMIRSAAIHESKKNDNLVLLIERYMFRENYKVHGDCALIMAASNDNIDSFRYLFDRKLYPAEITFDNIIDESYAQPNVIKYLVFTHGVSIEKYNERIQELNGVLNRREMVEIPSEIKKMMKNVQSERNKLLTAHYSDVMFVFRQGVKRSREEEYGSNKEAKLW
jgi:hypothetical protein